MNNLFRQAKDFFHSMPSEVADTWLAECVESRGWPPAGPNWEALLRGYTPGQWQHFVWEKRDTNLYSLDYTHKARGIISGLAAARFANSKNAFTNIENSDARMRSIFVHLMQTGSLPGAVVLINDGQWEIVDGSHRIACYVACLNSPHHAGAIKQHQPSWVATLGRANV